MNIKAFLQACPSSMNSKASKESLLVRFCITITITAVSTVTTPAIAVLTKIDLQLLQMTVLK